MDDPIKYLGYAHIALEVTDINAAQQALQNKGIVITDGPITLPDGAVMLFIRDQDKNVIEFHQPRLQP